MDNDDKRCGNCVAWQAVSTRFECHFNPPLAVDALGMGIWPRTHSYQSCHQHVLDEGAVIGQTEAEAKAEQAAVEESRLAEKDTIISTEEAPGF